MCYTYVNISPYNWVIFLLCVVHSCFGRWEKWGEGSVCVDVSTLRSDFKTNIMPPPPPPTTHHWRRRHASQAYHGGGGHALAQFPTCVEKNSLFWKTRGFFFSLRGKIVCCSPCYFLLRLRILECVAKSLLIKNLQMLMARAYPPPPMKKKK